MTSMRVLLALGARGLPALLLAAGMASALAQTADTAGPALTPAQLPQINLPGLTDLNLSVPRPVRAATAALGLGRQRLALVVGQSKLGSRLVVDNAPRDAQAVAGALREAGFVVMLREDLSAADLRTSLKEFRERLMPGGIGFIYATGLGAQVDGVNLLLPREALLDAAAAPAAVVAQLRKSGVPLAELVDALLGTPDSPRLLVVDAAYQHPALARLPALGLAEPRLPPGLMALFGHGLGSLKEVPAVAPLPIPEPKAPPEIAASPFAVALVNAMATPRVNGPEALRATRRALFDASQGQANPWIGGDTDSKEELAEASLLDALVPRTPEELAREGARQLVRVASRSGEQPVGEVLSQPTGSGLTSDTARRTVPEAPTASGGGTSLLGSAANVAGTVASVVGTVGAVSAAAQAAGGVAAVSTAASVLGTAASAVGNVAGTAARATSAVSGAETPVRQVAQQVASSATAAPTAAAVSMPAPIAPATINTVAAIAPATAPAAAAAETLASTAGTAAATAATAPVAAAAIAPAAAVAAGSTAVAAAEATAAAAQGGSNAARRLAQAAATTVAESAAAPAPARKPNGPAATDGRTTRSADGGERPVYTPRTNAFGYSEGDTFTYRVTDGWKDEVIQEYTTAIEEVLSDGKIVANGHLVQMDPQGRLLKMANADGTTSVFEPSQELWWSKPERGQSRPVKFIEKLTQGSRARGQIEWKGSTSVGKLRRIETPAGEFDVLPMESSGWWYQTNPGGGLTSGQWNRTVWYSPKLGHPVAIDIEDADRLGRLLKRERVELVHAQSARTAAP